MKKLVFKKAVFLTSALKTEELPAVALPEIAVVGRSNVGKSSLINHLLRSKTVAKVSSRPGKTQRINCFVIDDALLLVDLPGYGYAKTSKSLQEEWGVWIDKYLKERGLKLILFLIDARRDLTEEDKQFIIWAEHHCIPLLLILTKGDKLTQKEQHAMRKRLEDEKILSGFPPLLYSIKEGKCREALIHELNKALWD
ncbi:MAG: YihA family ribosome biogenesis GTP-binding protein [Chlamydiia bacterium]|nr:YihA family ribosome biogenesis GTP-binding protein [Chlamydiia bacterium]